MPKTWNGVMATISTPSRAEIAQAENFQWPANDYPTRANEATYVTTSPATYRFSNGQLLPGEAAPAVVSNPAREEITGQDIINKYYNLAKQSTAARTNDPYAVAKSLAARDGYNLDQLVRNRQAIIGR